MKANKALKRLSKIETLMADVEKRFSASAPHLHDVLKDLKAAVARVKDAVSTHAATPAAKKKSAPSGKKSAAKKAAVKSAKKAAAKKRAASGKTSPKAALKKTAPSPVPPASSAVSGTMAASADAE